MCTSLHQFFKDRGEHIQNTPHNTRLFTHYQSPSPGNEISGTEVVKKKRQRFLRLSICITKLLEVAQNPTSQFWS
jgi:hypothetical protein